MALRQRKGHTTEGKSHTKEPLRPARKHPLRWLGLGIVVLCAIYWTSTSRVHRNVEDKPQFHLTVDHERRQAVVEAFKVKRDAFGYDNYHPFTKKGTNLSDNGGIGYFIVDVLDTLQIMNLTEEYSRAREWVAHELTFERSDNFNTFETTIRVLGGLLSAYHLSDNDPVFLEKAVDLGQRILAAFDTPSGLPLPMVDLRKRRGVGEDWNPNLVGTAEATTLQLELRYLSYLTDDDEYWVKAEKVMSLIRDAKADFGLAPVYMDASTGGYIPADVRLGSRGDSFYEYLLNNSHLEQEQKEDVYRQMYAESMDGIHMHLIQRGLHEGHLYTREFVTSGMYAWGEPEWTSSPKQDHLVCFLGGSLMLGAVTTGAKTRTEVGTRDWLTGRALIETCMDTYNSSTGLSPEIAHFYVPDDGRNPEENRFKDWYVKGMEFPDLPPSYDARYMLRPETVESLFIAFRLTGNRKYRAYGWSIFQAIQKHARVETGGYATVLDVNNVDSEKEDKMETFFLSETLKYLYLLFSDETTLPLDRYVFNTEAHPLPKFTPSIRTGFS
ncbi:mannosidase [Coprinopsis sp. MPI-PUGE-AT-0042]|nr:mannosidase [Coprinopsis sp. MPI-PUGE-AT-0042]